MKLDDERQNAFSILPRAIQKVIIKTNAKRANQTYTYATPIKVAKGDELGMFEMGSTIVLFIQDFTPNVATQQIVKFAQNIGYIN